MRIVVTVDDQRFTVDVDPSVREVRWGDRAYPVRAVEDSGARIVLEIGGEPVTVEAATALSSTPTEIVVNGERFSVTVERDRSEPTPLRAPAPSLSRRSTGPVAADRETGVPVRPPMPGKVIEVRVKEGEAVAKGQVLLVVEAMKMRNEVTSPVAGTVRKLTVAPGTSVKAQDSLLFVVPGT